MQDPKIINCWNSIGIWGREKPRCPLLNEIIHCRNCEKFLESGILALDRDVPEDYKSEWTEFLAGNAINRIESRHSMLVFKLNSFWFSLPSIIFSQISPIRPIRALPHRENNILMGLVNISGEILLCFSLQNLMRLQNNSDSEDVPSKYLAVFEDGKHKFVFPINEILGMHDMNSGFSQIESKHELELDKYLSRVISIHDKTVFCLDSAEVVQQLNRSIV